MKYCLVFLAFSCCAAQDTAVVEGVAFNRVTHAGLGGVTVRLTTAGHPENPLYETRTDLTGAFRIEGVPPGVYAPAFDVPAGFFPPMPSDPASKPFRVAAGAGSAKLDVPIVPMGKLRGRVLDPEGHPVANVRVEIFRVHGSSGHFLTTDGEGRFHEENIVPGAYRIRARPVLAGTPLGRKPESITPLSPKPPEGDRWIWAPTYFPNAIDLAAAQSIFVREGMDLDGFDIRLRAAPVFRLRGVARDDDGKPASGAAVRLLSEIGWGAAEAEVKAGADGSFEFPNVRAGEWRLEAEAARGGVSWKGFAELTMPKRDLEDVVLRISQPFHLDALVDGLPPESRASGLLFTAHGDTEALTASLEKGRLPFDGLYPGRYLPDIWLTSPRPVYYLKRILLGERDVTGRDIELTAASPPLRYQFAENAARASGDVADGAGVKVVMIETDPEVFVPGSSLRVAVADAEGRFTLDGLRPGAWYAFAFATFDNMNVAAIRDRVFQGGLSRSAETIHLKEGEAASLHLKISPWAE